MIKQILGIAGTVIIVLFVAATALATIKGAVSSELYNENLIARKTLEKPDEFVKCKNTELYTTDLFSVTMSYLPFDVSDSERARVLAVQQKFKEQLNAQCDPIVKAYEENFETYKRTSNEIAKAEMSLFDKIIGTDPTIPDSKFLEYSPTFAEMTSGSAATNTLYSRSDVEEFYARELGY